MEQILFPTPPPCPSPASAKVSCQGANKLEQNKCLMNFYDFMRRKNKETFKNQYKS